jgi:hypothetical protein
MKSKNSLLCSQLCSYLDHRKLKNAYCIVNFVVIWIKRNPREHTMNRTTMGGKLDLDIASTQEQTNIIAQTFGL